MNLKELAEKYINEQKMIFGNTNTLIRDDEIAVTIRHSKNKVSCFRKINNILVQEPVGEQPKGISRSTLKFISDYMKIGNYYGIIFAIQEPIIKSIMDEFELKTVSVNHAVFNTLPSGKSWFCYIAEESTKKVTGYIEIMEDLGQSVHLMFNDFPLIAIECTFHGFCLRNGQQTLYIDIIVDTDDYVLRVQELEGEKTEREIKDQLYNVLKNILIGKFAEKELENVFSPPSEWYNEMVGKAIYNEKHFEMFKKIHQYLLLKYDYKEIESYSRKVLETNSKCVKWIDDIWIINIMNHYFIIDGEEGELQICDNLIKAKEICFEIMCSDVFSHFEEANSILNQAAI